MSVWFGYGDTSDSVKHTHYGVSRRNFFVPSTKCQALKLVGGRFSLLCTIVPGTLELECLALSAATAGP